MRGQQELRRAEEERAVARHSERLATNTAELLAHQLYTDNRTVSIKSEATSEMLI